MDDNADKPKPSLSEIFQELAKPHQEYKYKERLKYDELYEKRNYPPGPVQATALWAASNGIDVTDKNVVDFGCGNGTLSQMLRNYHAYIGVDISKYITEKGMRERKNDKVYFVPYSITDFKMPGRAHIGYCIDVMEHIPEEYIEKTLYSITRNVQVIVFSISTRPSTWKAKDGSNLHLTVKDAAWWKETISIYFDIHKESEMKDSLLLIAEIKKDNKDE